jgi:hypothetical protein
VDGGLAVAGTKEGRQAGVTTMLITNLTHH